MKEAHTDSSSDSGDMYIDQSDNSKHHVTKTMIEFSGLQQTEESANLIKAVLNTDSEDKKKNIKSKIHKQKNYSVSTESKKYYKFEFTENTKNLPSDTASNPTSNTFSCKNNQEIQLKPQGFAIGESNFESIINNRNKYIDKTPFIKEIIDDPSIVKLIIRPRRFGKTLAMSMLNAFFQKSENSDKNKVLFQNLKIWQEDEYYRGHQGKYPVIFITFKDIKSNSFEGAYQEFKLILSDIYKYYKNILFNGCLKQNKDEKELYQTIITKKGDASDTKVALKKLTQYLNWEYGEKVIILIDEYDTPIHASYCDNYFEKMADFMRGFLGAALKDNSFLRQSVLTGILRVSKESIFSGLNNIRIYSMLSEKYSSCFGFSADEVSNLLGTSKNKELLADIEFWYGGYNIGNQTLYNPWSIINFIEDNEANLNKSNTKYLFNQYWINTSENKLVFDILKTDLLKIKEKIESLVMNKIIMQKIDENIVFSNIKENDTTLWSFLLLSGYLTSIKIEKSFSESFSYRLIIPNNEVYLFYLELFNTNFRNSNHTNLCFKPFKYNKIEGIYDIQVKLKKVMLEIESVKNQDIVCIFGTSGSGKSTLINYLLGTTFSFDGDLQYSGKLFADIGKGHQSVTEHIGIYKSKEGLCYCDFPGFGDTRGSEYELFTQASIEMAMKIAKSVKIIFIFSLSGRAHSLKRLISGFIQYIQYPLMKNLSQHVLFIIYEFGNYRKYDVQMYSQEIKSIHFEKTDESDLIGSCIGNSDDLILLDIFDQGESRTNIINKLLVTATSKKIFNFNVISAIDGVNYSEFGSQEVEEVNHPAVVKNQDNTFINKKNQFTLSSFATNNNYNPMLMPGKKENTENPSVDNVIEIQNQSQDNKTSSKKNDEEPYCCLL